MQVIWASTLSMLHMTAHISFPGDSDLAVMLECPRMDLSLFTGSLPYTLECPANLEMSNTPYKDS